MPQATDSDIPEALKPAETRNAVLGMSFSMASSSELLYI